MKNSSLLTDSIWEFANRSSLLNRLINWTIWEGHGHPPSREEQAGAQRREVACLQTQTQVSGFQMQYLKLLHAASLVH